MYFKIKNNEEQFLLHLSALILEIQNSKKTDLEDRYFLKNLQLLFVVLHLSLREKPFYLLFLSPNLDKSWKSWSSNEVLGREKQIKKRGQEAVEDDLHQLK